jgi:uncharacterized Fe-S radical SAM superfamily protein PflX
LQWVRDHLPRSASLSLRDSYLPSWRSQRYPELSQPLPVADGVAARASAARVGLTVIQ